MMTCIALDDEPLALDLLQAYCAQTPFLDLQKTFTQASEAAKHMTKFPVDLLFLDVNMPDISGIDFYKGLPQQTLVIFTTAHSEYAVEGFNLSAVDYLLKPFGYERFLQAARKAQEHHQHLLASNNPEVQFLFVRSEYSLVKLALDEILYIETLDDYLKIHLNGRKPVLTLMSMKTMLEKLPPKRFIRTHRSFIVSLDRVEAVRGKMIQLGPAEIPIGSTYETEFLKAYTGTTEG